MKSTEPDHIGPAAVALSQVSNARIRLESSQRGACFIFLRSRRSFGRPRRHWERASAPDPHRPKL